MRESPYPSKRDLTKTTAALSYRRHTALACGWSAVSWLGSVVVGKMKSPTPSKVDVVFYTIKAGAEVLLYLPVMCIVLAWVLATGGPGQCWRFLRTTWHASLSGNGQN